MIDIDRALADMGARTLMTDFRLAGPYAAAVVAQLVAEILLTTGFDAFAPFEIQEAARPLLALPRPPSAGPIKARPMTPANILVVRAGRQRDKIGLYIRHVLGGRMKVSDALLMLSSAIGRRGLWACLSIVGRHVARSLRGGVRTTQQDAL